MNGGRADINDLKGALHLAGASAVAAGSLFVYYGSQKAVLINFPSESQLIENKIYICNPVWRCFMKIALINVNCKHSSTGKIVYDLYTELNKNGHEAAVFYGRGPKIKEKNIFKFGIDLETYFHAFMTRISGFTGVFSPFSTYRVIRKLKKFKPDIVHIHELHAYFINLKPIMNYLKNAPVKVIWTFHCEFMFTGKCAITYDCNKWQTECHKCPQVKEYPKSLVFDFSNPMFRQKKELFKEFNNLTIVTPSKWLENRVIISFLRDKKTVVIPNGIDQKIFSNRTVEFTEKFEVFKGKIVILSVASDIMSENKGGQRILDISKKISNKNLLFILIGTTNKNSSEYENVIFIDRTSNQNELSMYYNIASLYLVLSKSENYPSTCLESLSCGTPILGYNVGGIPETAQKGHGDFVEYGDNSKIIEYLDKLKILDDKNRLLIAQNYQHIHSKERMMSDYIKLYKDESSGVTL